MQKRDYHETLDDWEAQCVDVWHKTLQQQALKQNINNSNGYIANLTVNGTSFWKQKDEWTVKYSLSVYKVIRQKNVTYEAKSNSQRMMWLYQYLPLLQTESRVNEVKWQYGMMCFEFDVHKRIRRQTSMAIINTKEECICINIFCYGML